MMKRTIPPLLITFLLFLLPSLGAATVGTMDKDELKALLEQDAAVVVDVRTGRDWSASELKIKGAVRIENDDFSPLAAHPKDATFVLYCA